MCKASHVRQCTGRGRAAVVVSGGLWEVTPVHSLAVPNPAGCCSWLPGSPGCCGWKLQMLCFGTVTLGQSAASSTQRGPPVAAGKVTGKTEPDQNKMNLDTGLYT